MSDTIRLRIFGCEFPIRVPKGGRERAERLAGQVDTRMREISSASGNVSARDVAILAALNLVDELECSDAPVEGPIENRIEALCAQLAQTLEGASQSE